MQPLKPKKKQQMEKAAPSAAPTTSEMIERAELLKSRLFARNPETLAAPQEKLRQESELQELLELDRKLRPEAYKQRDQQQEKDDKETESES